MLRSGECLHHQRERQHLEMYQTPAQAHLPRSGHVGHWPDTLGIGPQVDGAWRHACELVTQYATLPPLSSTTCRLLHPFPRHVTLEFNLGDGATVVTAELDLERNADLPGSDLFLDGEELKLFRVYTRDSVGKVVQLKVTNTPCAVY